MTNALYPYRQWLDWQHAEPPNFYQLLDIEPSEADARQVAAAAEKILSRVRRHRPGPNALVWARLLDEIQDAKRTLTDPQRKAAYDHRLEAELALPGRAVAELGEAAGKSNRDLGAADSSSQPARAASAAGPNPPPPREFLFPPRTYRDAVGLSLIPLARKLPPPSSRPPESPPIQPLPASSIAPEPAPTLEMPPDDKPGPPLAMPRDETAVPPRAMPLEAVTLPLGASRGSDPDVSIALARRLADSAPTSVAKTWAFSAIIGIAIGLAGLGFLAWQQERRRSETEVSNRELITALLAEIEAEEAARDLGEASTPALGDELTPALPDSAGDAAAPAAETMHPTDGPPLAGESQRGQPQESGDAADKLRLLGDALMQVRAALRRLDLKEAQAWLEEARALAERPEHEAMLGRLSILRHLVGEFLFAIEAGHQQLEAGVQFPIDSTEVVVVERTADALILREEGQNRTYPLDALPSRVAVALATLQLGSDHARLQLLRTAYLTAISEQQPLDNSFREMWRQASQDWPEAAALLPLLEDRYDLAD